VKGKAPDELVEDIEIQEKIPSPSTGQGGGEKAIFSRLGGGEGGGDVFGRFWATFSSTRRFQNPRTFGR